MVKKCLFCGRFYRANPRCKNQKACWRKNCKKARRQLAFSNWHRKNPEYFKGRYIYVKEWRARQNALKRRRAVKRDTSRDAFKSALFKLSFFVPGNLRKLMIQNKLIFKRFGRNTYFAAARL